METLAEITRREVAAYAGRMLNGWSYMTVDEANQVFAVVSVATGKTERWVGADLIARIAGDQVVIEYDSNNKPLVDALVQAGIPRQQIVLAYAGEVIPPEQQTV